MILDLKKPTDQKRAQVYLDKLILDLSKIDIVKISKKRTNSQNRYLHALFQLWSAYYGYTLEEGKTVVKIKLGYIYVRDNITFFVQTSKMDTKELSVLVDRFRNLSSSQGYYLPTSTEFKENFVEIMKEVERAEIMEKRYGY